MIYYIIKNYYIKNKYIKIKMQSKEMLNKSPEINLKQLKNQLLIPETEEIKKKKYRKYKTK